MKRISAQISALLVVFNKNTNFHKYPQSSYIHIYFSLYTYACTHIRVCVYNIYAYIEYKYLYIYLCESTYAYMDARMYTSVCVRVHACLCVCIFDMSMYETRLYVPLYM